ncbi:hypothetical protein CA13_73460 [Planctomycetes bacterium CA13]|uniref:Uncharacterized protein n=2 Tax=Novipirellula herctigrandis TaxID=2527986 RepID=A0A5C5YLF3_9BACT|nr:hypothetical protein CA13_73460 [Planctomycetes bacterium CA13]
MMNRIRIRFGIRTLLVVATIAGIAFWFFLPFTPSVRIDAERVTTDPARYGNRQVLRSLLTNDGVFSVWFAGHSGRVSNFSYVQTGNAGTDDWFSQTSTPIHWAKLRPGDSVAIESPIHGDYDSVRIGADVSDWRGRLSGVWSEPIQYSSQTGG